MSQPVAARRGRPPRADSTGAAWTIRSTEGELAAYADAAEQAGLSRAEWARQALDQAAGAARPRFASLDDVLVYVRRLEAEEDRDALAKLLDRLALVIAGDIAIMRAAIAWANGKGEEIARACEEHRAEVRR